MIESDDGQIKARKNHKDDNQKYYKGKWGLGALVWSWIIKPSTEVLLSVWSAPSKWHVPRMRSGQVQVQQLWQNSYPLDLAPKPKEVCIIQCNSPPSSRFQIRKTQKSWNSLFYKFPTRYNASFHLLPSKIYLNTLLLCIIIYNYSHR